MFATLKLAFNFIIKVCSGFTKIGHKASLISSLALQRVEEALNRTGLNGRQCVLRAICELRETPIHEASLLGETITLLLM